MIQCIGFITAKDQNSLWPEDLLIAQKLRDEHGIRVLVIPWGNQLPKVCQAVVLRSCHDYPKHLQEFKIWLQSLEQQKVTVLNHPSLVRENLDKKYLLQLKKSGVSIVPTVRFEAGSQASLKSIMADSGWNKVVIKPSVSLGAADTSLIGMNYKDSEFQIFDELLAKQPMLVQPFISEITRFGEISLIYFGGRFSHAVSKQPAENDFRVQRRFGGVYNPTTPSDFVLESAFKSIELLLKVPTYVRIDGVIVDGEFLLMELELIEPRLYLSTCPDATDRFANTIISHFLNNKE